MEFYDQQSFSPEGFYYPTEKSVYEKHEPSFKTPSSLTRSSLVKIPSFPEEVAVLDQISPDKLRLALEAISIAIWEWNLLTDQVTWYSSHQPLPGLDSTLFKGRYTTFLNYIDAGDRDRIASSMKTAIANRQNYHQDLQIITADHQTCWVALNCQLICNPAGQAVQMIGTTIDITERKRAELALQRQTERERLLTLMTQRLRRSLNLEEILNTTVAEVQQLLQADRVVVYRFQPDWSGTVVVEAKTDCCQSIAGKLIQDSYFGEQYAQFYRQGGITAITDVHTAGLDPHYLNTLLQLQVRSILILPISQGETLWGLLVVHQCSYFRHWESVEINLLRRLANQLAVAVHQSELHQQVQALNNALEQQVQERTAQLQQAFEFEAVLRRITEKVRDSLSESQILQTAVQELALALKVESCNTALYDLQQRTARICYEYTASSVAMRGQILDMDAYPEIYRPLLQGHTLEYCPWLFQSGLPSVVKLACPILVRSTLTHENEELLGDLWLTCPSDRAFSAQEVRLVQQVANQCAIALRQARLYQAAQRQVQELERLNQLKDDFLSTVSHELRTPMASIKVAIQMLEVVLKPLGILNPPEKAARYFQILQHESEREIRLINDLLDLSRLDTDTTPLVLHPVNLQQWIPRAVEPFKQQTDSHQQQIKVDLDPCLPPITTESSHLERIFTELMQNACKYTPAGETITVKATSHTKGIQLSICNSGVEIAPTERDRIFDKFYRIPNHDPWRHGGTGLGLALVQRLVDKIGATVQVASELNQTTFTVQLPVE